MFSHSLRAVAPLLLIFATPIAAQPSAPISSDDLMRHIRVLASDQYQGRAPGTPGETLTTSYIIQQFRERGLEPAGEDGGWLQPVVLISRGVGGHQARWTARNRAIAFEQDQVVFHGRRETERLVDAPVVFAGHGARIADRGIDQLAGVDVRGAVVLIMMEGPDVPGFPSLAERTTAVSEAGAAAVIGIIGSDVPWPRVRGFLTGQSATRLQSTPVPAITGTMPLSAAQSLLQAAGGNIERLLNEQPGSSFRAVQLPLRLTVDVRTNISGITTANVVGKVRGSGNVGQSILLLSHWDHLGICRPEGIADRICNGAVDNASGIASLIEIAGHVARAPRPQRDILFLATTAEEMGLLGAEYFAAHPTVPAGSIVAAINMDTVAVHRSGLPVATIGRGIEPALDQVVDAAVRAAGRQLDTDDEANVMVQRQDGWKLNQAGIPTIMVSGSFSDMNVLGGFLQGSYHQPNDEVTPGLRLDGATEDANLLVDLTRRLADPADYQRRR